MVRPLSHLSPRAQKWIHSLLWILVTVLLAILLVKFVVRSYSVEGISMEPTLRTGEIVFSNKLGATFGDIANKPFIPKRGQLIVFKNPFYNQGDPNAFIVKRVLALPGEHVIVRDGRVTVVTPEGTRINPDEGIVGPQNPTSGNVDRTVPENEVFVAGDNRSGKNSLDSRNGMSTLPVRDIEGIVLFRFWPITRFSWL